jgi:Eco57I restriction-modification methylase
MSFLDDEERYKVNVIDWSGLDGFSEIMKSGGFDAVIGNPPYVNAWELYNSMPHVRDFINSHSTFSTAERHWDLYVLFLERSLQLARQKGRVSFIIPYSYAIRKYATASRSLILQRYKIESIADLRTVRVFGKVPVITIIPVISKIPPEPQHAVEIYGPGLTATKFHPGDIHMTHRVFQALLYAQHEHMLRIDLTQDAQTICDKLEATSITISDICLVNYGAQMSSREKGGFGKDHVLRNEKASKTCKKTVSGRNLYRYAVSWDGKYVEWSLVS